MAALSGSRVSWALAMVGIAGAGAWLTFQGTTHRGHGAPSPDPGAVGMRNAADSGSVTATADRVPLAMERGGQGQDAGSVVAGEPGDSEVWTTLPRHTERWLFVRLAGMPEDLTSRTLVRSEPLNPRDVRVGEDGFAALDTVLKPAVQHLAELKKSQSTIRNQEAHDLVAAKILAPVENATIDNLTAAERPEFDRFLGLYRVRMQEDPSVRNAWKSAEEMALAKLTQERAGGDALRTGDEWYRLPSAMMVRTHGMDDAIASAREAVLAALCAWSAGRGLIEADETARLLEKFAEFCRLHLRR